MAAPDLAAPDLYINRELAFLEFNRRVLEQAKKDEVPLLERLRFLCISSSNLDEFFEIRVAGLKQQEALGGTHRGADNQTPSEQLRRIAELTHELVAEQYRVMNDVLFPLLDAEGIRFRRRATWDKRQRQWLKQYFNRELEPILTPIGLDPAHPFPRPLNKSLSFIVTLEGKDAFGRSSGMAIVQAPRALPRVVLLPDSHAEAPHEFVFLSSIIHAHVDELFAGMKATGCYQFRVTRNSDLLLDEEEVDDLLRAMEGELPSRRFGDEVRMELAQECPEPVERFLQAQFDLDDMDVYSCNGPVNLMRLMQIPDLVDRPDLKYPGFTPRVSRRIQRATDVFSAIREGDVLLHHPFDSFAPVVDFLRQAASDPSVLAIRQTLYRTGADSAVVKALVDAASNGKEVLVVIELRARFDEAANIELATHLQEAGAQVVYGVVGYKTHAKMCMVIRREGRKLVRYVHLGTGNYHARTARLYTDYGLFTCDDAFGQDVQKVFKQLTTMGRAGRLKKMLQSPFTLHSTMLSHIETEIANAGKGLSARVVAKMNSLVEPGVIQALYRASQAGVSVDLVVRGMCALRPGVEGVSENIRVFSVIGRFLEHTRVFYFENASEDAPKGGAAPRVYLSSADWMQRNFFDRVETCFPVEDEGLRRAVIRDLELYLADSTKWELKPDGIYEQGAQTGKRVVAQELLLETLPD
ncbi:MAG: polyphosphate kinase 1 [Gammaproteobacteria bacterium]|nr:polyphosphate kinase 1 [Gammaproteobacteria bacterium]